MKAFYFCLVIVSLFKISFASNVDFFGYRDKQNHTYLLFKEKSQITLTKTNCISHKEVIYNFTVEHTKKDKKRHFFTGKTFSLKAKKAHKKFTSAHFKGFLNNKYKEISFYEFSPKLEYAKLTQIVLCRRIQKLDFPMTDFGFRGNDVYFNVHERGYFFYHIDINQKNNFFNNDLGFPDPKKIYRISFSQSGSIALIEHTNGTFQVWNCERRPPTKIMEKHLWPDNFYMDNSGQKIINRNKSIYYPFEEEEQVHNLKGPFNLIDQIYFSFDDSKALIFADGFKHPSYHDIYLYSFDTDSHQKIDSAENCKTACFSHDNELFAMGSSDGNIKIFRANNPHKPIHEYAAHDLEIGLLAFSPKDEVLLSVGKDSQVVFYSPVYGYEIARYFWSIPTPSRLNIRVSPDFLFLLSESDKKISLWTLPYVVHFFANKKSHQT